MVGAGGAVGGGAGCASVPSAGGAADPIEPLRQRLPDDAALYVLVRPAELHAALDALGGRLASTDKDWERPGGLLRAVLGKLDLGEIKGLARADFFERSGLDDRSVVALAFLRAPEDDLLLGKGLVSAPAGHAEDVCPQPRTSVVAKVREPAVAVHYLERRRLKGKVDGSWVWIDGRPADSATPAPPRWRLPDLPTADRPLTARLSVDRLGAADQLVALRRDCANLAGARLPSRRRGGPASGCDAAWHSERPSVHRLDVHLERGASELSVVATMDRTSEGAAAMRAGLTAPTTWDIPDTAALGVRARFDARAARGVADSKPVSVSARHCSLYTRLGPLFRWPGHSGPLGAVMRGGLLDGVTAAALDLPADPAQPLSARAALEYGRPARALRLGGDRLGLDLAPGEEEVIELPILGSDLRVRLEDGGRTSRLAVGFAVAPPAGGHGDDAEDRWQIARLVLRPARLDSLAKALALFSPMGGLAEWTSADVELLEAEVRLAPPRLVAAFRVRWAALRPTACGEGAHASPCTPRTAAGGVAPGSQVPESTSDRSRLASDAP